MRGMVTRVLLAAVVASVGLTGCSGGTSTAYSPAPSTAASAPPVESAGPDIKQAQSNYLDASGKVVAAYDTFYNLYDAGSTDLPALQKAAAGVAAELGAFANFVRDYDWPPSVPSDLPATIHELYTTREGGMDTWVKVAAADSLAEMKERLKETDTPEATSDTDTDTLRKAIGLPPAVKPGPSG